ncbi:hypothetical protein [Pedobacter rhizosphaerae]|uniref:Uncharacterized protein n=1 Tax=Pedobacter rhizosphaerae TaxID=390241 RepID=A0A1H9S2K1_9SPHI|nr:hypothetical protein [Pedobacter rhizosphaerae]SER79164.1 hypothetical protein SAMN04488023_11699 [Pedobacter rhizosphaerae]
MGKLKLYDLNLSREQVLAERESIYLSLTAQQRFFKTLQLNHTSVAMNGGQPIKTPQGLGLVIRKPKA